MNGSGIRGNGGRYPESERSARSGGWDDGRSDHLSSGSLSGRSRQPGQPARRDFPVRGGGPSPADPRRLRPEEMQVRGRSPQHQGRSRLAAVVVLIVVAVIIAVTGIALGKGDGSAGSGQSLTFELLPFPQNAVTTTTQ